VLTVGREIPIRINGPGMLCSPKPSYQKSGGGKYRQKGKDIKQITVYRYTNIPLMENTIITAYPKRLIISIKSK